MFSPLTPAGAYVFGFLATDGCCLERTVAIELQARDEPILDQFFGLFKEAGYRPKLNRIIKAGREYSQFRVNSVELVRQLAASGLTQRKSQTVPFFEFVPDELLPDYLRGIFDGDGSIMTRGNTGIVVEIYSASSGFIHGLNAGLERIGIPQHHIGTRIRNRRVPLHRITLTKYSRHFLDRIYYPGCICLERKRRVFADFSPKPDRRYTWTPEQDAFLLANQYLHFKVLCEKLEKTRAAVFLRKSILRRRLLGA